MPPRSGHLGSPAYLALFYRVFGEHLAVARAANVAAGAAVVVPVYFIGERLFSVRAGVAGALIAALFPSLVFWSPILLSDTLFTTLLTSAAACFVCAVPRKGDEIRWAAVALGSALLAFATLVRGEALVLLPAVAVWWCINGTTLRDVVRSCGLSIVVVIVFLTP